jgi:hypothetical protein
VKQIQGGILYVGFTEYYRKKSPAHEIAFLKNRQHIRIAEQQQGAARVSSSR